MAAATSSKQLLRQLRDKDPSRRKSAIKALARSKDRNALTQLARMSGDDRDAEVRELALKAGQYILHETGGLQVEVEGPPPVKLDKKGRPIRVKVSEKNQAQAQRMVDAALSAQQSNDVVKAMRLLSKALETDPNLRMDSYFSSLAEGATGLEGPDAIEKLYSKDAQTEAEQASTMARRREHDAAHLDKVSQFGWRDIGLDMSMLAVIASLACILVGFLAMQSAQGYIDRVLENNERANEAMLAGRIVNDIESKFFGMYIAEEPDAEGDPVLFARMEPDPQFWNTAFDVSEASTVAILGGGLGAGLAFALMCSLMVAIIHVLSSLIGGRGTLTFTGHAVLGLLVNRAVILAAIAAIGTYLIFSNGGGTMVTIVMVLVGIVVAQMLLKLFGRLTNAYDYGMPQALIATIAGMLAFVPFAIVILSLL